MKPDYKKVSHYNTGQPWDNKAKQNGKKQNAVIDNPCAEIPLDDDKFVKQLKKYQLQAFEELQKHFYGDYHLGNKTFWKVLSDTSEPTKVATIYKANSVPVGYNGAVSEIEGAVYDVEEHKVYDMQVDYWSHLKPYYITPVPTLKDHVKSFLKEEEIRDTFPKNEYSLLILPDHILTEREKDAKADRLEEFVKEHISNAVAPVKLALVNHQIYSDNYRQQINYQSTVIEQQRSQIYELEARLAVFEASQRAAEAARFTGTNHRVFVED